MQVPLMDELVKYNRIEHINKFNYILTIPILKISINKE